MKTFSLKTQKIKDVPFHYLLSPETSHLLVGLENYKDWLIPQALETLHKMFLLERNTEGLFSATLSFEKTKAALTTDEFKWLGGIVTYLTRPIRKEIIGTTVQIKNPNVSALVPLGLSAFKMFRKIQYEEWDKTDPKLNIFMDKPLLAAALSNIDTPNTVDLISYREHSRIVQSGKTEGNIKELTHTVKILHTDNKEFNSLPSLAKIMYCQVWVAHPRIRTDLMILDPINWDKVPSPLVEEELTPIKYKKEEVLAWNQ